MRFTINLITSDNGEKCLVEMENTTLMFALSAAMMFTAFGGVPVSDVDHDFRLPLLHIVRFRACGLQRLEVTTAQ